MTTPREKRTTEVRIAFWTIIAGAVLIEVALSGIDWRLGFFVGGCFAMTFGVLCLRGA